MAVPTRCALRIVGEYLTDKYDVLIICDESYAELAGAFKAVVGASESRRSRITSCLACG